jgi:hypothetical protein
VSSALTFLRPLRYDRVRTVLLVQTGPAELVAPIVGRLRELFPGCTVDVLMREADLQPSLVLGADSVEAARYEERFELVARLRKQRFDGVVMQLGGAATRELRLLPFLLRTRAIIAFNARLDYFPVNVFRIASIAEHFGAQQSAGAARTVFWLLRRACIELCLAPLAVIYLTFAAAALHLRGWWRRRQRAARAGQVAT